MLAILVQNGKETHFNTFFSLKSNLNLVIAIKVIVVPQVLFPRTVIRIINRLELKRWPVERLMTVKALNG